MSNNTEKNNLMLIEAVKSVKVIKDRYEAELKQRFTNELYEKIIEINQIIQNAEELINCTEEDAKEIYTKRFPSHVGKDGNINLRGIKRLNLLNKRWNF